MLSPSHRGSLIACKKCGEETGHRALTLPSTARRDSTGKRSFSSAHGGEEGKSLPLPFLYQLRHGVAQEVRAIRHEYDAHYGRSFTCAGSRAYACMHPRVR